ncbi:TPA: GNAT family N-acetyltransferase [Vibrio vulnificus]|nr:GNAT family N-acetyltransferase [Vibrio vulnificus]HDY7749710.1 GNAT family N-acetyltransferase [Vibrio vulnificus]HDY7759056.1 GNAT family N-acetyltransferase [Vibrio vulnificus]HDY7763744.1 GNAT family N-acetyltransferase [Vibrio vulnificus]HDY7772911.1 GNAT family N-acetyltransferase [Vibrio vulnificus]
MSIEIIREAAWPEILKLQSEVYLLVEPESLEVLTDKWNRTPKCCFIYRDCEELKGYLLAHSWNKEQPPKLFNVLPKETEGDILFLHDLAIASSSFGQGIGSKLMKHLVGIATGLGFKEIRLVSVQNSEPFWQRQGFKPLSENVCKSYGADAQLMWRKL